MKQVMIIAPSAKIANLVRGGDSSAEVIASELKKIANFQDKLAILDQFSYGEEKEKKLFSEAFYHWAKSKADTVSPDDIKEMRYYYNYIFILQNLEREQRFPLIAKLEAKALVTVLNMLGVSNPHEELVTQIYISAVIKAVADDDLKTVLAVSKFLDEKYSHKTLAAAGNALINLVNWARPNTLQDKKKVDQEFYTNQIKHSMHVAIAGYIHKQDGKSNDVIKRYLKKHIIEFLEYLAKDHFIHNHYGFNSQSTDQTDVAVILCSEVVKDLLREDKKGIYVPYILNIIKQRTEISYHILYDEFYHKYIDHIKDGDKAILDKLFYNFVISAPPSKLNIYRELIDYIVNLSDFLSHGLQQNDYYEEFLGKFLPKAVEEEKTLPKIRAKILAKIVISDKAPAYLSFIKGLNIFNNDDIEKALTEVPLEDYTFANQLFANHLKKAELPKEVAAPLPVPVPQFTPAPPPETAPHSRPATSVEVPLSPAKSKLTTAVFDSKPLSDKVLSIIASKFFKLPSPLDETFENILQNAIAKKGIEVSHVDKFAEKFVDEMKEEKAIATYTAKKDRSWVQFIKNLCSKIYSMVFSKFGAKPTGPLLGEGIISYSEGFNVDSFSKVIDAVVKKNTSAAGMSGRS